MLPAKVTGSFCWVMLRDALGQRESRDAELHHRVQLCSRFWIHAGDAGNGSPGDNGSIVSGQLANAGGISRQRYRDVPPVLSGNVL